MRNGTGRNNIVWGGSSSTNGQYLRKTSTGRNNIAYITINNTNGTYNLLERTSTGRNNIRWNNLTFSFGGDLTKIPSVMDVIASWHPSSGSSTNANIVFDDEGRYFPNVSFTRNTISLGKGGASPSIVSAELTKFKAIKFQESGTTVNITGRSSSVYYDMSGSDGTVLYIELTHRLFGGSVLIFS